MRWKKVTATTSGATIGAGVGSVTLGPLFAGIGAVIGGPAAPITSALGYGLGCAISGLFGGYAGKKIGDKLEEDEIQKNE